jgi:hypothetical protein
MSKLFEPRSLGLLGGTRSIDCEVPSTCPHCHRHMTPNLIHTGPRVDEPLGFPLLYRCTYPECREFFAIFLLVNREVTIIGDRRSYTYTGTEIKKYTYAPKPVYDMPDEIDSISPFFKAIYSQSQIAEAYGLTQISGVGFRKSIEFLVKDYLKHESITNKSGKTADGMTLSQAINLIPVERIKSLALAAAWLGNDETHYVREFNSHDVEDMKGFIKALGHEVSSIVAADKAKSLIASKGSNSPTS